MTIFHKLPGESEDYGINWSGRLAGEVISATKWGWYVQSGLSAIQSSTGTGTGSALTEVRLSGGLAGSSYWVSGYIHTSASGRILYEYFKVSVGGVTG